jgi:hypothetical protein
VTTDGLTMSMNVREPDRYSVEVLRSSAGTDFIEDYSSPIWLTRFVVKDPKRDAKRGTAVLPTKVSGAGKLKVTGKSLATVRKHSNGRALLEPKVKPEGKLAKKLRKRGKARVRARVAFTPSDGKTATETVTVKLKRR